MNETSITKENDSLSKIGWNFDNSYARLPEAFFVLHAPKPVRAPKLTIFNERLAEELGLNVEELSSEMGVSQFAGNTIPEGAEPLAQAYAGHQFGHFNMLGDGRAVLLGEHITPEGERLDIQLKGPGRTPFSRGGDGRAAIKPMLREYIISEAMHSLGIPTTRSLAVVETGEAVIRETELPGAILTRVAASHIRVGTFQYVANWRPIEELRQLADYTINRHYPELEQEENKYLSLLQGVINRQASLIAKWQLVGFIHGVMNTDNMTISGETIDYGPCAFMDQYDPETVFSSIDRQGRYAYGNQPHYGGWNIARFAETLLPLLDEKEDKAIELAQEALSSYADSFMNNWQKGMREKLGLFNEEKEDEALIQNLLDLMKEFEADFTNTFRLLTIEKHEETALAGKKEFVEWSEKWQKRLGRQAESKKDSQQLMMKSNPVVIPRNHLVEEALEAAESGDNSVMEKLLNILSKPYEYSVEHTEYCKLPTPSNQPYRTFCGT
ncbi:protein adenylyltransferase SelO [Bacillus suaedaesalsae]|uniref:Protein nucleotidyltransferase YdiU n=1 Tax=Bacillus suaedaesalsae TaxID=2810349 RepID=A0ABS2DDS1_9BACI|nr:YdiU family protein [Bacillus suaedaesalsae]MBM6616613.1 YdiU family protein [Bacillus suaedaesalsae]